jgi:superfamily I DNA and/or RNA helicase
MEARAVASIIQKLLGHGISPDSMGVIAFYKAHVDALARAVSHIQGEHDGIHIATVDSFQGAEKDIIILSTATSKPSSFAADACRLNVALTRAKHHLLLVGNIHSLSKGIPSFEFILSRAKAHQGYFLGGLPSDI